MIIIIVAVVEGVPFGIPSIRTFNLPDINVGSLKIVDPRMHANLPESPFLFRRHGQSIKDYLNVDTDQLKALKPNVDETDGEQTRIITAIFLTSLVILFLISFICFLVCLKPKKQPSKRLLLFRSIQHASPSLYLLPSTPE